MSRDCQFGPHIWRDRIDLADILVAAPGTSQLKFKLMLAAETNRRALRATAGAAYRRLIKGERK